MYKDTMNRWLTTGLFHETATKEGTAIMSLDEGRKRFVELGDMTGYLFATKYLGGYPHWKALEASSFSSHIEDWREELEVKLRCESLSRIADEASHGHFQANKFLADRGWETRGAGRPTREEVKKNVARESRVVEASKRFLVPIRTDDK